MITSRTSDVVLRRALLADGGTVDIRLREGHIESVVDAGTMPIDGPEEVHDLHGYLLLPAPAEPHAHLDKAYSADRVLNASGDLAGAVAAWLNYRPGMTHGDVVARATQGIRTYLSHGGTAIRTHVDVGTDVGLLTVDALVHVREALRDLCDLQIVAFVGVPLSGVAGADNRALLRDAMAHGADVVGGVPAFDPDPASYIELCLGAAADAGAPVDLHVDETLEVEICTLSTLARVVSATGFAHPVAASHCVSLGMMPAEQARPLAEELAGAKIAVISLPQTNLYLQGRDRPVATPRGLTAVRTLREAGVLVAAGGDNLQDPFNCVGRGDPLEAAALLVLAGHDLPQTAYEAVSAAARRAMGLPEVAVRAGAPAELLAIAAGSVREAIASADPQRLVIHRGRVVARTSVDREFPGAPHSTVLRRSA